MSIIFDSTTFRYLWVGILNTVIGISVFPVLYFLFHWFVQSVTLLIFFSYVISGLITFTNQKKLVFRYEKNYAGALAKFVVIQACAMTANALALPEVENALGIHTVVAQLIVVTPLIVFGYLASRFWIFTTREITKTQS